MERGDLSEIRRDDSTDRRVSSFAVLDALLQMLSDRQHWPALDLVVLAGHSAGGQFVQRYAVAGRAPRCSAIMASTPGLSSPTLPPTSISMRDGRQNTALPPSPGRAAADLITINMA